MQTITLQNGSTANIYDVKHARSVAIYLHGGGLIYGSKADIPSRLVDILNAHHMTVLSIDYLLAPNSALDVILDGLLSSFEELKRNYIGELPYLLCGRSAGAYLMFKLTEYIMTHGLTPPHRLINFYGYHQLAFYNNRTAQIDRVILSFDAIQHINTKSVVWDDANLSRYPLYVYALQKCLNLDYLGINEDHLDEYSVLEDKLSKFPPTFSTASTSDNEVPFKYSKKITRQIPHSKFVPVYYFEHDFLSKVGDPNVEAVFSKLDEWLGAS